MAALAGRRRHARARRPQPATVSVLAAVFFNAVRYVDGRELIDVAPDLDDAYGDRLIVRDTDGQWTLTDLGEQELAKWWGPGPGAAVGVRDARIVRRPRRLRQPSRRPAGMPPVRHGKGPSRVPLTTPHRPSP